MIRIDVKYVILVSLGICKRINIYKNNVVLLLI